MSDNILHKGRLFWAPASLKDIFIISGLLGLSAARWDIIGYSFVAWLFLAYLKPLYKLYLVVISCSAIFILWALIASLLKEFGKPHSTLGLITLSSLIGILCLFIVSFFIRVFSEAVILYSTEINEEKIQTEELQYVEEAQPEAFNPYGILNINPDASQDEIKSAYINQIKNYHPDKVAHLGDKLKEEANKQTLLIQKAYDMLKVAA